MFDLPEFAPDISYANFENLPFTDVVENLIPHATGYESVPSFRRIAKKPIDSNILGSFSFVRANDDVDVYNLVGTSTNIYRFGKNPKKYEDSIQYFYDISKDGGYNITDDSEWSFAVFGEYIIAVNPNHPMQILNMDDETWKFKDVPNAPRAHKVKVWGNYIALINILDPDSHNRDEIAWSGVNNITDWNFTDRASDADRQRLYDGGQVLNATSSENPYIFLRNKIYRGSFNPSSSLVFVFRAINFDGGIKIADSLIEANGLVFFYSDQGFYKINVDGSIVNIGKNKVNEWVDRLIKKAGSLNLQGYYAKDSTRVYWALKDIYNLNVYGTLLVYDYALDRWSYIKTNVKHILNFTSIKYTLDDLDIISNLDELPASLDSSLWQEDSTVLAAIDNEGYLCSMTGSPLDARITIQALSDGNTGMTVFNKFKLGALNVKYTLNTYTRYGYGIDKEDPWLPWRVKEEHPAPRSKVILSPKRARILKLEFNIKPNDKTSKFLINKYHFEAFPAGLL